ncbi:MAG: biosynthetic-type acetolactate synthase large subunit [Planctomycetia bacterium]|nr:biosynthetic-type acetolactate synthase large subunit [Planctomycetia bacterium]
MAGTEIVVASLLRHGVSTIFAYPGAVTMPLHQTLTHYRDKIRVLLPRHEQGGGFAAQGYARATGKLGVCMATSGPGATNLITSIADAKLDSVPMLIITGQVTTSTIGYDGFQETPMTEICRCITKHHYLVTRIEDLARTMDEAIFVATTGRPGPVLVDLPKDVLVSQCYPNFEEPRNLPGYHGQAPSASEEQLDALIAAVTDSRRPVLFAGGGIVAAQCEPELRKFVETTHVPVTTSLPAMAAFDRDHELALGMLGMHGTVTANRAVHHCDLLLAFGVRFSDRVTGKLSEFAKGARVIHVDIDPSEIDKVRHVNLGIVADLKDTLTRLNEKMRGLAFDSHDSWLAEIDVWQQKYPLTWNQESPYILPEMAVHELWQATREKNVIIATGVGQHQMWTAQFYHFSRPRTWISSCGLGTMGFGLPAAMGVKIARPDALVIDVDGDGSLQMNIQELATCHTENIPVKVMLLNNQHLGMVMQWEDRFHGANRGNTYLGCVSDPEAFGKGDGVSPAHRYPDYPGIARCYGWSARSVTKKEELRDAIDEMINTDGPFLLEVNVPYREHVLPMTPPGGTIDNVILK